MDKKMRILYINGGLMDRGGVSSVMMNYYLHFTDHNIRVDFLGHGVGPGVRDEEILGRGGKVFNIPAKSKNFFGNYKQLKTIIKNGRYDIVHAHADSGNAYLLKVAKECGVPVRISHSHNTNYTINNKVRIFLNDIQKKQIKKYATNLWACSHKAAQWLYGNDNDVEVIHNAIETKKFCFSMEQRDKIRDIYGLENKYVIGIVGRLDYQKNHSFMLDVIKEYVTIEPNAKLMIIGDGKLKEDLVKKVDDLKINDNVIFVGQVQNVYDFYSAFDVLVMPSLFEGLPVSAIEAQTSGLPCLISEEVTKEVNLGYNVSYLNIKNPKVWVEQLQNVKNIERDFDKAPARVADAGYDIQREADRIQKRYWKLKEEII